MVIYVALFVYNVDHMQKSWVQILIVSTSVIVLNFVFETEWCLLHQTQHSALAHLKLRKRFGETEQQGKRIEDDKQIHSKLSSLYLG